MAPDRGFPLGEYRDRLDRAQRAMGKANVDLLLLTTEPEVRYFSGFHTAFWQSPTRPWFLLVPQSGRVVAVIPAIGAVCMAHTWVDDIRTWASPCPADEGVSLLCDALLELAGPNGRIGLQTGPGTHLRMPLDDLQRVRQALPCVHWQDTTALLEELRSIKSPLEIAKIRHVCLAASSAFGKLPATIEHGMSDVDLFREFRLTCLACGVDEVNYLVGGVGSGGYADIIAPPVGRALAHGDVMMLDTGCTYDGYFCDFDRNLALGAADAATHAAYRRVWEATEAGLAAVRPGALCSEIFNSMQDVMTPAGTPDASARTGIHADRSSVGRLGHGLGMQLTEPPSLMPDDHRVLQPNMVMTLEPGYAYAADRLMVHEENLVVTETGYELLSVRAAEALPVVDWPR